jgi:hypothetical protein
MNPFYAVLETSHLKALILLKWIYLVLQKKRERNIFSVSQQPIVHSFSTTELTHNHGNR